MATTQTDAPSLTPPTRGRGRRWASVTALLLGAALSQAAHAQDAMAPEKIPACKDPTAATTVRVLVLDLEVGQPSLASIAASLGPVIAGEARKAQGFEIITSAEIRSALTVESANQLAGCTDTSCLAEIAEALDADLLVNGRVDLTDYENAGADETGESQSGAAPRLSLSLLNTRAIVTVNRVSMAWPGDPSALPDVARAATQMLILEKSARPPGRFVLDGLPEGAQVFVDDEEVTSSVMVGDPAVVEVGPHRVRVIADGYISRTDVALAKSGETTRLDGTLEPEGLSAWWLWGGGAAAIAAGVGATLLVVAATTKAAVVVDVDPKLPSFDRLRGSTP